MNGRQRDIKVNWHPFSHLNDEQVINIVRGEGSCLFDENGNKFIDAVSSWWVNLHGHSHPHIINVIKEQLNKLDHSIFAGFTHPKAIELSERLLEFVPGNFKKVFYSDDGSTANEVALKLAIQYFVNSGKPRKKIIAFENSYHGDTFGVMSVGGRSVFNAAFNEWMLEEVIHIPVPVNGYSESEWKKVKSFFTKDVATFIFEPIVQGAGGMVMYDAPTLDRLIALANENEIITIADEVMTGFGRTGKWFATEYLQNKPDLMCLSKGITGGVLPLGTTLVSEKITKAFESKDKEKFFYHGHSYTANAIACSAACANLDLLNDECMKKIRNISDHNKKFIGRIQSNAIKNPRSLGTIMAVEFLAKESGYTSELRSKMYNYFIKKGLLMRPLGNVCYIIPPYCISEKELQEIYNAILEFPETN